MGAFKLLKGKLQYVAKKKIEDPRHMSISYIYYVPSNGSICDLPSNTRATPIIEKRRKHSLRHMKLREKNSNDNTGNGGTSHIALRSNPEMHCLSLRIDTNQVLVNLSNLKKAT